MCLPSSIFSLLKLAIAMNIRNSRSTVTSLLSILCFPAFFLAGAHVLAQDEATPETSSPDVLQDDPVPELKSPVDKADDSKAESMAVYMDGLARQKEGDISEALEAFEKAARLDPKAPEPVKAQALLLMRMGRVEQAEKMARKAIKLDSKDYETRLQLALLLTSRKRPEEAMKLVEEALQSKDLKPKSVEALQLHKVRATLSRGTEDFQKAAESYGVVLDALDKPEDYGLDFRQHQIYLNDRQGGYEAIGRLMLLIGNNKQATRAFAGLARSRNDEPGIHHLLLATAQYRTDDLEDANRNLERYFETQQRSKSSLQLLTDLLRADNKGGEILPRLKELAVDTPDASIVNLFLGEELISQGETEQAGEIFRQVLADSGDVDARLGLVRIAVVEQNEAQLVKEISKAIRARISLAELLPLKERIVFEAEFGKVVVEEAITSLEANGKPTSLDTFFYSQIAQDLELEEQEETLLRSTLNLNPDPRLGVEVLERLGFNLLLQEKYEESSATYRNLLSIPGIGGQKQLVALYRLSQAEAFNENYPDAIKAIETALQMSPGNPELTYQLGWVQVQSEDFENAERNLKKASKLSTEDPGLEGRSSMLLGAVYSQVRRWKDAVVVYEDVLEISGLDGDTIRRARVALSNAYVQGGDLTNGQRILEEVYQNSPDDPGVNNDLGYLYADQGIELEKAAGMIEMAVKAEPENPAFLDSLGWVYFKLKKYDEALEALKKANADPDYQDSTLLEHLGDVHIALGQQSEAAEAFRKALSAESDGATPDESIVDRLKKKLQKLDPAPEAEGGSDS